jgi:hypothetical protein
LRKSAFALRDIFATKLWPPCAYGMDQCVTAGGAGLAHISGYGRRNTMSAVQLA